MERVLFIAPEMEPRGTSEYTVNLARELLNRGLNVAVFCGPGPMLEDLSDSPIAVKTFESLESVWFRFSEGEKFLAELAQFDPQIVHGQTLRVARVLRTIAASSKAPIVLTVHRAPRRSRSLSTLSNKLAGVIATTEHVREELVNKSHVDKAKITVIHNGIDTSTPAEQVRPIFSGSVPVVGSVGPVEKARGHELFLRSAAALVRTGRKLQFVVAGEGEELPRLRRLGSRLELDDVLTFVTDFSSYDDVLDALDVVVQTSLVDVSAFSILEAMGRGRPVIAFNTGTACEIIQDGNTGRLIPLDDVGRLTGAIQELTDDPARARQMGQTAQAYVAEWFDIKEVADLTLQFYSKILAEQDLSRPEP